MKRSIISKEYSASVILMLASLLTSWTNPVVASMTAIHGNACSNPAPALESVLPPGEISSNSSSKPDQAEQARIIEAYGKLPISFEANQGQTDPEARFLARGKGYSLFLTPSEAVLDLRKGACKACEDSGSGPVFKTSKKARTRAVLRMKLDKANPSPRVDGLDELPGKVNYFKGNDREKWRRNVPTFARVAYRDVYPGTDMVYYGNQQQLEYDFIVSAGADPNQIALTFEGAEKLYVNREGSLVIQTKAGDVVQQAPVVYQEANGSRQAIAGRYVLKGKRQVGFKVGTYDSKKSLVIDPKLIYATFLGGFTKYLPDTDPALLGDKANGIAADSSGNAYITGSTNSSDFPVTGGAFQEELNLQGADTCQGGSGAVLQCGDVFVTKLNPQGTDLVYSTYIGSHNNDEARGIAVDSTGNAYITGGTDPFNVGSFCINPYLWPVVNGYQGHSCYDLRGKSDAFLTVVNSSGSDLLYSTYFGAGDIDIGNAIAVDNNGKAYITGETLSNGLNKKNEFQSDRAGGKDAFVAKFDTKLSGNDSLLYSSFLGGTGDDIGKGIAFDSAGNAYVAGSTTSSNLQTKSPSGPPFQSSFGGGSFDAFVAKVDVTNASGASSLTYLTYLGGTGIDRANAVAVDSFQRAYVTGFSNSVSGFPLVNQFDSTQQGGEVFVTKFNADGTTLFYSTFLGGNLNDEATGIAIDSGTNVYVTGTTVSTSFPSINAFQPVKGSALDAFVTKIDGNAVPLKILYSSFLGGTGTERSNAIALDSKGNVYLAGNAESNTFPATPGAFKTTSNATTQNQDGFVAKVAPSFPDSIGVFRPSTSQFFLRNSNTAGNADLTFTFGQAGDIPVAGDWNGDGVDDAGVFRPSAGQFLLRVPGISIVCNPTCHIVFSVTTITINFGVPGDLPVAGDWNGDGIDTPGVFRNGQFLLTNGPNTNNSFPPVNFTANLGAAGDLPVAGDWNGDGIDSIGVFEPSFGVFLLSNSNTTGAIDFTFVFGAAEDLPLAGDWNGDGVDTIGTFRPSVATFFLNNINDDFNANFVLIFNFGATGDQPVGGDWNGKP